MVRIGKRQEVVRYCKVLKFLWSLSPLLELRKITMKVPTDLTIPEIEEIRKEGVKALVERLGIAKAAFLQHPNL